MDRRSARPGAVSRRGSAALSWRDAARRAAGFDRGSRGGGADLRRGGVGDRAAGRQYRSGRRRGPARRPRQYRPRPRPDEPDPRDRPGQFHDDGRGRLHPRQSAPGGGRSRPAVSAEPRRRGQLPDRRQSVDQCRRHRRLALRQYPRADLGRRGRIARRTGLGRAAWAAQGQHRLRSETAVHRRRGHARHHHRGDDQAVSKAARGRDRVSRPRHGSRMR